MEKTKLSNNLASPSEAALSHLSEFNGTHLSPHFTLSEFLNIDKYPDNKPTLQHVANMTYGCLMLLEPARLEVGPIIINSGYRSEEVNKAIGGVKGSNHLTGCAADIHVSGMEQLIRYAAILLDISDESREDFDELLLERSPRGTYWLHFAVRPSDNRRKVRLIQTSLI